MLDLNKKLFFRRCGRPDLHVGAVDGVYIVFDLDGQVRGLGEKVVNGLNRVFVDGEWLECDVYASKQDAGEGIYIYYEGAFLRVGKWVLVNSKYHACDGLVRNSEHVLAFNGDIKELV